MHASQCSLRPLIQLCPDYKQLYLEGFKTTVSFLQSIQNPTYHTERSNFLARPQFLEGYNKARLGFLHSVVKSAQLEEQLSKLYTANFLHPARRNASIPLSN